MHPNSLANLRPWKPGERPQPSPRKVDRALQIIHDLSPKAAALIGRCMLDEEQPMSLRIRCGEYVLDRALGPAKGGAELHIGGGAEWLELRFVKPGEAAAAPETHRITFDGAVTDVEANETSDVG